MWTEVFQNIRYWQVMFEAVRMSLLAGSSSDWQSFMVAQERKEDIKLNGKKCSNWQQASDAFLSLQGNAKSGSVWDRLVKFNTGDTCNGSFELRCKKCGQKCQMMNPAANSAKQLYSLHIAYHESLDAFLVCLQTLRRASVV
jgi:hypothetical protein